MGGLCCKSRNLQRSRFLAKTQNAQRSMIRIVSLALPKSPMSLARGDEGPQIITPTTCQQSSEFLTPSAKGLLQQYRGKTGSHRHTVKTALLTQVGHLGH